MLICQYNGMWYSFCMNEFSRGEVLPCGASAAIVFDEHQADRFYAQMETTREIMAEKLGHESHILTRVNRTRARIFLTLEHGTVEGEQERASYLIEQAIGSAGLLLAKVEDLKVSCEYPDFRDTPSVTSIGSFDLVSKLAS